MFYAKSFCEWKNPTLTSAPLALQIFHHYWGWGGVGGLVKTTRLSRLLLVVEKKNGKSVRKLVKNDDETISVNFSLRSKL